MTKKVIERLNNDKLISDKQGEDRIIRLGRAYLATQQMTRRSYVNLFVFTLKFISWKTWLAQLAVFAMGIVLAIREASLYDISVHLQSLTAVVFISVIFFLEELFKSFTTGMWELEQTFKYDLRQHTLVKLLIFGLFDMCLIFILAALTNSVSRQPLMDLLLYLLVPYNIICILLFAILTAWRRSIESYSLWLTVALTLLLAFIFANTLNIYQLALHYWLLAYVITGITLACLIYRQLQKVIREEVF